MLTDIVEFISLIADFIVSGIQSLFSFFEAVVTGVPQAFAIVQTLPTPMYFYLAASGALSVVGIIVALL